MPVRVCGILFSPLPAAMPMNVCVSAGQLEFVQPYLALVPVWSRNWGIPESSVRAVLKSIADILAAAGDR